MFLCYFDMMTEQRSQDQHSRAASNTPATNFFPFRFFPFMIFSILFFSSLIFFFFYWFFFSYCKEKIYWCHLFYIVQNLGDDNIFSLQVGLNFFIKTRLFLRFKNAFKKTWIFLFFLYFKLIFFLFFLYYFDVMI
jgi:hypothetical protein